MSIGKGNCLSWVQQQQQKKYLNTQMLKID